MQRLAREVLGEVVLVHAELARRVAQNERAPILRDARTVDRIDDLERILDHRFRRHVEEGAALPEGGVGGLELVAVDREALGEVARDELGVLREGLLERAQHDSLLARLSVQLDVDDHAGALHDLAHARALGQRG